MNKTDLIKHKFVVFGVDNYNALGVLRSLGSKGIKPILIAQDTRCNVSYMSKYISDYYRIETFEEGYQILLKFGNPMCPTFIITNDDKAQVFINDHYSELKASGFIMFNCNGKDIRDYMNKKKILEIAAGLGFDILKTIVIYKGWSAPKDLEYPVITKAISPLAGRWKKDSYICENEEELNQAISEIESEQILIQKFIDKKNEYCIDGFSVEHGKDIELTFATTYNYNIRGYYSPYMTVSEVEPWIEEKLSLLFRLLEFEGIFTVEFLIDQDGKFYFSEVNFRNSTWNYIGTKLDRNIPYRWALSSLKNHVIPGRGLSIPRNYTAMVEPIDYQKRVVDRDYNRMKWFIDFLRTNCKFYFNIKDLKPFFHMLRNNKKLR